MKTSNTLGNTPQAKVAFYTRISTDEDHQKYSLDAQKDRLEAYCKSQYGDDWQIFKVYRDMESGTHMNRPGLEEMLYDAQAQAFNTLLVFRVDRLSRKVRELALMVDELTKHKVVLKSITEPFDTANAAGKMMLQMLGVFAEFEHATIVERTKMGMEKKAKGGQWVGGVVPFGYRLEPEKGLVVQEEEALIVRKMFQMYAFGKEGVFTICNRLQETGQRKRSGKPWDRRIVLHMLRNPLYLGKVRWREVVYAGHHEALVSETLFGKVQEVLKERTEDLKGRQWHNTDERLLTGMIKCAKCGAHMFGGGGQKATRYIPYYVCSKRFNSHTCEQDYVRADLLEAAIAQDIKAMFRDEQFMARVWEQANRRLQGEKPDVEKEIARVEALATKAQASLDRYFGAFEAGTMKPELCHQKIEDLNVRLKQLEEEKLALDARRKRLDLPAIDQAMLSGLLEYIQKEITSGTNLQQKQLIKRLVKKVVVHDRKTIEVWYGLPNRAGSNTGTYGSPGRIRTFDQAVNSRLLYR